MSVQQNSSQVSIFSPEANGTLVHLAKILSFVINPNFCQFFIFIFFRNSPDIIIYGLSFFFLAILPLIGYVIYVRYVLKRENLYVLERNRRFIPFFVNIFSIGIFHITLNYLGYVEQNTLIIMQFLWFLNIFAMCITFFWRISIHQIATSASFALIMFLYSGLNLSIMNIGLLFLLIAVGWSRYYLRGHTLPQIIAGSCIGYFSILGYLYFLKKLLPA